MATLGDDTIYQLGRALRNPADAAAIGETVADNIDAAADVGALTDNSGGAAADKTIGVVTAPTAIAATLTDSTSFSGTHDDTLASVAAPVTLTDSTGLSGTHDDTLAATTVPAALTEGGGAIGGTSDGDLTALVDPAGDAGASVIAGIRENATRINTIQTLLGVMVQNDSDTAQKVIELVTLVTVLGQNQSDVGQKIIELVARQAENRTAIVAATDAIKELATQINLFRTNLRAANLML